MVRGGERLLRLREVTVLQLFAQSSRAGAPAPHVHIINGLLILHSIPKILSRRVRKVLVSCCGDEHTYAG